MEWGDDENINDWVHNHNQTFTGRLSEKRNWKGYRCLHFKCATQSGRLLIHCSGGVCLQLEILCSIIIIQLQLLLVEFVEWFLDRDLSFFVGAVLRIPCFCVWGRTHKSSKFELKDISLTIPSTWCCLWLNSSEKCGKYSWDVFLPLRSKEFRKNVKCPTKAEEGAFFA